MITINMAKLKLSMAELQRRRKDVIKAGDAGYRQKVYYLLRLAAEVSPQFSGDFASNWAIAVDGNMPVYRPWAGKEALGAERLDGVSGAVSYRSAAHRAGDPEAIATTLARGAAALRGVTMKSKIHLVNSSPLWTDGTHMIGPDGIETLRPENVIPGRVRIESYLRARAREQTPLKG